MTLMPPRIVAASAAFPPHRHAQAAIREAVRAHWGDLEERELDVFVNAGVETRSLGFPLDYYFAGHGFGRRNRDYQELGLALGERAIREALARAGLDPADVGHLVFVTTTGLATPSLDAILAGRLGLPARVARTPLFGAGCAGGAVGVAKAADGLRGRPDSVAVVLSVELCGQTFLAHDRRKANVVASALFGDGAAAAVLVGSARAAGSPGLDVVDSRSELLPGSLDLMGWDFVDEGFRLLLSPRIPAEAKTTIAPRIAAYACEGDDEPVAHWLLHPGGPRVLDGLAAGLGLDDGDLRWSRDVLRRQGNLSSATVLVALADFLEGAAPAEGDRAMLAAVGPGFAIEATRLRWRAGGR